MADLKHDLDEKVRLINTALNRHIPGETTRPAALHKAIRYSVFAGGKRLRPLLCLAAAEAVGGTSEIALLPAIAIEALHTYTLIHDDLPCMDDDDMRRGKPSCHIVFGEANAILAGDALLTLAFEWLADVQPSRPYKPNQLILELALAAGSRGVVGGQVEDLASEGKKPDRELVEYIHLHKTADLIRASVRMGGIVAGATDNQLEALTQYGNNIGLAFQITDDILNETSSAKELGKGVRSDRQRGKMTYVAAHGLETAGTMAASLTNEAVTAIRAIQSNTELLAALARLMMERTH